MAILDGQTALVTGAGSPAGIGFAIARALAAHGARVALAATTARIHDRAAELGAPHQGFIADLVSPAEVGKLHSLVPAIAKAVVSAVKADGFNVGQNNGIAANQIVPHVHVHIVPRFHDDSPDGKWPARRVASGEELAKIAHKIRQEINLVPSK